MSIAIAYALILLGLLSLGMWLDSITKRTRKNRYRKVLPPPSPLCSRGFDYK